MEAESSDIVTSKKAKFKFQWKFLLNGYGFELFLLPIVYSTTALYIFTHPSGQFRYWFSNLVSLRAITSRLPRGLHRAIACNNHCDKYGENQTAKVLITSQSDGNTQKFSVTDKMWLLYM